MRRNLYAPLAVIVLAACGDPAGSSGSRQGSLRFDFTGAATGSYLAEAPAQDTAGTSGFALARTNPLGYEIDSRSALRRRPSYACASPPTSGAPASTRSSRSATLLSDRRRTPDQV